MLNRDMLIAELESLRAREEALKTEMNQIIGARQFCEFALKKMDEPAEQPAPTEMSDAGAGEE